MHCHLRRRSIAAVLITLALLTTACGGGDTANPTSPSTDDTTTALAEAIRIDASVDARIADADDYTGINDPTPVNAGDNIRTDTTGFAEITYFDGSLTRLDINTDFTVLELNNAPGESIIRTQMGLGRTWHRVQTLTGNDTYQVETSVATAVVRGTAFVIECTPTACTFTVLEGTIELTLTDDTTITLTAGQTITIEANGEPLEPTTITGDPLTDPWLARNTTLDTQQGFTDLDAGESDATGSELPDAFEGTYAVTIRDVEFVERLGPWTNAEITMESDRTFGVSYVDGLNSGSSSNVGMLADTIEIWCVSSGCVVETPFPSDLVESEDGWRLASMMAGDDNSCGGVSSLRGPIGDIEIVDGTVESFTYTAGAGASRGEDCSSYWTARYVVVADRV